MFGQNTSSFGGGFNQPQNQGFGGGGGFGQNPMGGGGAGFGNMGQNPQTPMFGQSTSQGAGFGGNQGNLFGGGGNTSGFGGGSGFGQGQTGFGGGNAPQNSSGGGNFSSFSQATSQFQGGFNQSTSGFGGQGAFGQNKLTQSFSGGLGQQSQMNQGTGSGFYKTGGFEQQLTSIGVPFSSKNEQIQEQTKGGAAPNGLFYNIRAESRFANVSNQMLKVLDTLSQINNQPSPNYEGIAAQEYQQNSNNYIYAGKVAGGGQGSGMMGSVQQPGGFLGGNQPQGGFSSGIGGFNQQNKSAWGGAGQQPQQMFGGTSTGGFNTSSAPFGQTSAFGGAGGTGFLGQQNQTQNKPLFGGGPTTPFGQTQQTTGLGGGMFGQSSAPGGFGGGAMNQPFGTSQSTGTGMFGQQTQQPFGQGAGGSMFGGQTQQNAGAGGLFGSQNKPGTPAFGATQQTSTLFGGQQQTQLGSGSLPFGAQPLGGQQQQQPAQGTLFGGGQAQGGGLFGNQPAGGGLFGQGQTPSLGLGASGQQTGLQMGQTQSSLFAPKPMGGTTPGMGAQGSLFGATGSGGAQTTLGSGSLFGATAQQPSLTGTSSLFGNAGAQTPQQQPGQSSLFGQASKPTLGLGGQGSLFGQTSTLGQQPQIGSGLGLAGTSTGGSLFQPQPSYGMTGQPTQQQQPSMFSLTQSAGQQQQMQQMQQQQMQMVNPYLDPNRRIYGDMSAFLSEKSPFDNTEEELKKLKESVISGKEIDLYKEATPLDQFQRASDYIVSSAYRPPLISEEEDLQALNDMIAKKYSKRYKESKIESREERPVFNINKGFTTTQNRSSHQLREQKSFGTEQSLYSGGDNYNRPQRISLTGQQDTFKTPESQLYMAKPAMTRSSDINRNMMSEQEELSQNNPDILTISIVYPEAQGKPEKIEPLRIHKSRDVSDIYKKVEETLNKDKRIDYDHQDFQVIYRNSKLDHNLSLQDAGIIQNCKVQVIYMQTKPFDKSPSPPRPASKEMLNELAPKERLPREPKPNYQISPSMIDLSRMTLYQLQRVPDFTIKNEYGSIRFEGETDLTDVDLADIVTISPRSAEVYDDKRHNKPPVGQKLNKPAFITLNGINPKGSTKFEKEQELKIMSERNDMDHISYNSDTKQWIFKVKHFTKYGFGDEEEEQQEQQPVQTQLQGQAQIQQEQPKQGEIFA